jgi:zinc protease
LYALLPSGGDLAKTENALDAMLTKISNEGVSQAELDKARQQKLAAFWRSMSTISGKAQAMGGYEVFSGDYRKLFDAPAQFERVTVADIQRVASNLFRRENRTVGFIAQSPSK